MLNLDKMSGANLKLLHAAMTSEPDSARAMRATRRLRAKLDAAGVSVEDLAKRAGLAAPFTAVNLVTGNVVRLHSLHGPLRAVAGDPVKAARVVAAAAVEAVRVVLAAAPAEHPGRAPTLPAGKPARSNSTLPFVIAAMAEPGGATLAEMTLASGWRAPFEMAHLRNVAKRENRKIQDDGAVGEARRYWLAA